MVLVLGLLAAGYFYAYIHQFRRYDKTKYKPSLYMGVTCFLFALASVSGMLIGAATSINNLPLATLSARITVTLGMSAFVFYNMFAIAMTRPGEKMHGVWISFISFLIGTFIAWTCDIFVGGNIGGMRMFTETSRYKAAYWLPLIERILA